MQEAWDDTYVPITDVNNPEIRAHLTSLSQEDQATITAEEALEQANEIFKRQVLTSLMARRNRPLADYRIRSFEKSTWKSFARPEPQ